MVETKENLSVRLATEFMQSRQTFLQEFRDQLVEINKCESSHELLEYVEQSGGVDNLSNPELAFIIENTSCTNVLGEYVYMMRELHGSTTSELIQEERRFLLNGAITVIQSHEFNFPDSPVQLAFRNRHTLDAIDTEAAKRLLLNAREKRHKMEAQQLAEISKRRREGIGNRQLATTDRLNPDRAPQKKTAAGE